MLDRKLVGWVERSETHRSIVRWRNMMGFASALPILRTVLTQFLSGEAIVGTAKPPAEFAIDVLQDDHIGVDVRLVAGLGFLGGKLEEPGRTPRDPRGKTFLIFDQRLFT